MQKSRIYDFANICYFRKLSTSLTFLKIGECEKQPSGVKLFTNIVLHSKDKNYAVYRNCSISVCSIS